MVEQRTFDRDLYPLGWCVFAQGKSVSRVAPAGGQLKNKTDYNILQTLVLLLAPHVQRVKLVINVGTLNCQKNLTVNLLSDLGS